MLDISNLNHAHEVQLGGGGDRSTPRRSTRLRVIRARDDVPASITEGRGREDCPTERPCPHVRCPRHLQSDDTRANQYSNGEPRYPKRVDPRRPSCLLDFIERGSATVATTAKAMRLTERWVYILQRRALGKVLQRFLELGIEPERVLAALRRRARREP